MNALELFNALLFLIAVGFSEARGSNQLAYRAKRYGSYYKSTYYTYSGVGYARYGRVYARVKNLYTSYYNYMFTWMNTDAYTVYKSTPSGSISVCKNYEANDNGTFMGIFTCPLPYVPEDFAYCCGEKNAEYCCTFWDIPLNLVAVAVGCMMGFGLLLISIYIIVQLSLQKMKTDTEKRERKVNRRFGLIHRLSVELVNGKETNGVQPSSRKNSLDSLKKVCVSEYKSNGGTP